MSQRAYLHGASLCNPGRSDLPMPPAGGGVRVVGSPSDPTAPGAGTTRRSRSVMGSPQYSHRSVPPASCVAAGVQDQHLGTLGRPVRSGRPRPSAPTPPGTGRGPSGSDGTNRATPSAAARRAPPTSAAERSIRSSPVRDCAGTRRSGSIRGRRRGRSAASSARRGSRALGRARSSGRRSRSQVAWCKFSCQPGRGRPGVTLHIFIS